MHRLLMRVVVLVAVAFALIAERAAAAPRTDGSTPASADISRLVASVPAGTFDAVGTGAVSPALEALKLPGPVLRSEGKPELLTSNLAWGPHSAANSWGLAVALSRFGTLTGLRTIDTGIRFGRVHRTHPSYPHTKGLSFFQVGYASPFLAFSSIVRQDVEGRRLQTPTPQQVDALAFLGAVGCGCGPSPAVNVGGAYGFLGGGYSPGVLAHMSVAQIAGGLADPTNPIARHIDGLANLFAAAICRATHGQPQAVCSSRSVTAAASALLAHAAPPTVVIAQINLNAPRATSSAIGIAEVLKRGQRYGVAIVAQRMEPNHHNFYAVWLYNTPGDARLLRVVHPAVGRDGRLSTASPLPPNAKRYREIIVSLETSPKPKRPGHIALQGRLQLS